jgi:hypothetical protein
VHIVRGTPALFHLLPSAQPKFGQLRVRRASGLRVMTQTLSATGWPREARRPMAPRQKPRQTGRGLREVQRDCQSVRGATLSLLERGSSDHCGRLSRFVSWQVLSDPQKRRQYDLYGEDTQNVGGTYRCRTLHTAVHVANNTTQVVVVDTVAADAQVSADSTRTTSADCTTRSKFSAGAAKP